ncbi:MAG TPA: hypothetical protein VFX30_12245, partial [bacterium]|nr:hypothetical protein [bacterium]
MILFAILLCLFSTAAGAAEHTLRPRTDTKVRAAVDIEKGAMILLPRLPLAVTGKTLPNFQVEVIGDKVMVTPLRLSARTNLFIDFGENTIATVELIGVAGGGEDLINLVLGQDSRPAKPKSFERVAFPTDLRFLAGPWRVLKLGQKSTLAAITLKVNDGILVNDYVLLNFSLTNKSDAVLTVNDIQTVIQTLGGLTGNTILDSE